MRQSPIPKKCSPLLPPTNGFVTIVKNPYYVAAYRCFPGFSLYPAEAKKMPIEWSMTGIKLVCKSESEHTNIILIQPAKIKS